MSELALKLIAENKDKHARGEDARTLDLGNCGLKEVPEEVGELVWLEVLILCGKWEDFDFENMKFIPQNSNNQDRKNYIEFLPQCLLNLSILKKIFINNDSNARWSGNIDFEVISSLTQIEHFSYAGHDASFYVPKRFNIFENLTNLQVLDFNNSTYTVNFIEHISSLNLIVLRCPSFYDKFNYISRFDKLKYLETSEQNPTLKEVVSNLKNLEVLSLQNCFGLRNLEGFSNLLNLKYLSLSWCSVQDIAPLRELKKLKSISFFGLSDLQNIEVFSELPEIESIALYATKVNSITPIKNCFYKGIKLYWDEYSDSIILYKKGIYIKNCPILEPPIEILEQGTSSVLSYFDERSKQQFKNTQIKLILLGNSTTGKTTLSKYLREQACDPAQSTTHGIQNHRWQVPELDDLDMFTWKPENRNVEVNIWDFGGQEYYHATHRLFLSRNAVYALIWDAKTDKGGTEPTLIYYENDPQTYAVPLEHFSKAWWLKNLHFNLNKFSRHESEGDAPVPVLLVQNKCALGEDYEMQDVPNEFGNPPFLLPAKWRNNHIDLAAAANEQADGTQGEWTMRFKLFEKELLKTLESQMATYEFAVYHRDIRDSVRTLASADKPVNEMSWTDFEAMCRDIEPDAKMDLAQIYLRDITGDILYFNQNERLRHRVFLRPDWVCNRIYAILSRKVLEREGMFDLSWVREALQCDEGEALDFVELMRVFELVFPDRDEVGKINGHYVAPQYLPENCRKPEYLQGLKEDDILTHAFTLWFPDFLPKSHFARFISNWGEQAEGRVFWKNGLLFKIEGLKVLVEQGEEFRIRVEIQTGDRAKREAAMRRIFQSFLDLEEGQAGFAVSLNEQDFVWWADAFDAIQMQARQVKTYPKEVSKFIDIQPYTIFSKPNMATKKVFISYSKSDKDYLDEFKIQLASLRRQNLIETWDDTNLLPGQEWDPTIRHELKTADIIVLLVSSNLIATDYIWDVEMKAALERHDRGEAMVIPVIIRPCLWEDAPFGKLNALPRKGIPVDKWDNKDEAWAEVVKLIRKVL